MDGVARNGIIRNGVILDGVVRYRVNRHLGLHILLVAPIPIDVFLIHGVVYLIYFERQQQGRPVVLASLSSESLFKRTRITDFIGGKVSDDKTGITIGKRYVLGHSIHHLIVVLQRLVTLGSVVNGIGVGVGHNARRNGVKASQVECQHIFANSEFAGGISRCIEFSVVFPHADSTFGGNVNGTRQSVVGKHLRLVIAGFLIECVKPDFLVVVQVVAFIVEFL